MGLGSLLSALLGGGSAAPRASGGTSKARAPQDWTKETFDVPPDPAWRRVAVPDALVGEQHRREAILAWAAGSDRRVEAVRDEGNAHDRNAIAFWGAWSEGEIERRELLGFLPRETAADLARLRPAGMPLKAYPLSLYRRGDFLDLKVALLEPSARSEYWKARGEPAPAQIVEA